MTRKEAIQKLSNYSKALRNENEYTHKSVCDVIDVVVNTEPKWISVKERLPRHCETVAIISFHMIYIGYYSELTNTWFVDGEDDYNVTHWMPLPEPPIDLYVLANPD